MNSVLDRRQFLKTGASAAAPERFKKEAGVTP